MGRRRNGGIVLRGTESSIFYREETIYQRDFFVSVRLMDAHIEDMSWEGWGVITLIIIIIYVSHLVLK